MGSNLVKGREGYGVKSERMGVRDKKRGKKWTKMEEGEWSICETERWGNRAQTKFKWINK